MMPTSDLAPVVERLERENRNLISRLDKLEKQGKSSIPGLIANVLLLIMAGLLADYLGFFPYPVERLPLRARSVEAQEFIIRDRDGAMRGRLVADDKGFQVLDREGKPFPH